MREFAGCPGSRMIHFSSQENEKEALMGKGKSQLRQWPIQLQLTSSTAPYYQNADVLLAADCVAYALGEYGKEA